MFETFSEPARRVVFWARREAGRSGAEFIEPEHLLEGLLVEDQRAPSRPFFSAEQAEKLRQMMTTSGSSAAPKPDTMDMPLAASAKRALKLAQKNAGSSTVTLLHLLLALRSDEQSDVGKFLKLTGITKEQVHEAIRNQD
jgi:ATP-dependent Clp protease ATP-binding subunit ClpC